LQHNRDAAAVIVAQLDRWAGGFLHVSSTD
jgi:hypothetical protein